MHLLCYETCLSNSYEMRWLFILYFLLGLALHLTLGLLFFLFLSFPIIHLLGLAGWNFGFLWWGLAGMRPVHRRLLRGTLAIPCIMSHRAGTYPGLPGLVQGSLALFRRPSWFQPPATSLLHFPVSSILVRLEFYLLELWQSAMVEPMVVGILYQYIYPVETAAD